MNNTIHTAVFGTTSKGNVVDRILLVNEHGMEVSLINFGATIVSIKVPDNQGNFSDVVLGFEDIKDYESEHPFFGCIVGRYANRIAKGKFSLNGETYNLAINNGPNHIHGGPKGFSRKVWNIEKTFQNDSGQGVVFSYVSEDGEEGYPGELLVKVTYTLTPDNELDIHYEAKTNKTTIINLTNHVYVNLKDGGKTNIQNHRLKLNADYYTPVDNTSIPTGEILPVEGTPLDFREERMIGERIEDNHQQIIYGGGYDHNFIVNHTTPGLTFAAQVREPESGRVMKVYTTEPGIQFYTSNFLDGSFRGKGIAFKKRSAFCLETQHYPDSPNKPNFPSVLLNPGETFRSTTRYAFSTL